MNPSLISALTGASDLYKLEGTKGLDALAGKAADGTMFENVLHTAMDNISQTNGYLSEAENQEILFALGETDSTHDLTIALEKASTALQYTVAIRDKLLDAYKELMQIQI